MNAHATPSNKSGICKSRRVTAERNAAAALLTKRAVMKAQKIEAGEICLYREMWYMLRK
jgi:hypothetical protein